MPTILQGNLPHGIASGGVGSSCRRRKKQYETTTKQTRRDKIRHAACWAKFNREAAVLSRVKSTIEFIIAKSHFIAKGLRLPSRLESKCPAHVKIRPSQWITRWPPADRSRRDFASRNTQQSILYCRCLRTTTGAKQKYTRLIKRERANVERHPKPHAGKRDWEPPPHRFRRKDRTPCSIPSPRTTAQRHSTSTTADIYVSFTQRRQGWPPVGARAHTQLGF